MKKEHINNTSKPFYQLEIGKVKRTFNQRKKHFSQMSEEEKEYLVKKILEIDYSKIRLSSHLLSKGTNCSKKQIINILEKKNLKDLIIEYNETFKYGELEERVLIRNNDISKIQFQKNNDAAFWEFANLCFVIRLNDGKIITAYWNISKDNHDSIDWKRYDSSLIIVKETNNFKN